MLLAVSCLVCCHKKDDPEPSIPDLYQTQWEGTLRFPENGKSRECSIIIMFESKSSGDYIANGLPNNSELPRVAFDYEIEDRLLLIYNSSRVMNGIWWVGSGKNGTLILTKEPHTASEETLTLKKIKL